MKNNHLLLILSCIFLSGCATNPYTQFYSDNTVSISEELKANTLYPYSGKTQVYTTNNHNRDAQNLAEKGYMNIGVSSFHGTNPPSQSQLQKHAENVGADIVLYESHYMGSEVGAVPVFNFTPSKTSTTTSSGNVNVQTNSTAGYGTANAQYNGQSTTTTPGSMNTQWVPRTFHRNSHTATFWRQGKPRILGVNWNVIPVEIRRKIERSTGVYISMVIVGSPAFRANILKGNIITHIAGEEVMVPDDAGIVIKRYQGEEVDFTILRNGNEKTVPVKLNKERGE